MAWALLSFSVLGCGGSNPPATSSTSESPAGQTGSTGEEAAGTEAELTGDVRIHGSSTVFPVSRAVAEEYGEVSPKVKVSVGSAGTSGGMKKFVAGEIDICDASRKIKETEQEQCAAAGIEYIELTVAFDGLSVVVNPGNDWIDCLTVEQLKTIWRPESGETVMKWSDVNPDWPDEELKLYGPGTDSGTFDYFTAAINGEERASRADYTASENDNLLVRGVASDKGALGYFGYAYYAENKDQLKLLAIDGGNGCVAPDDTTVRDGSYSPLSRPLFIYVRLESLKRPEVASFVSYYLKNASRLVGDVGYVPVSDEVAKQNEELLKTALQ
ncbi:MAG: PstS family phosphate ABC transporter substrate-binding protein [Planctomycetales bacterium]|nr:PstS family phosphate ABC transporter substrate-binding protein [Planctomycetales bacterium]